MKVSAKRGLETGAIWEMTRKKMDPDKFTDNSKVAPLASQQRNDKFSLFFSCEERRAKRLLWEATYAMEECGLGSMLVRVLRPKIPTFWGRTHPPE